MPENKSPLRTIAAALIVAAGACLVAGVYAVGIDTQSATERDFIQYWAAERQLIHGANPYDVGAIFRMEKALGMEENSPKVTVSPPVAFFYALPLGYLGAKSALIVWLLILLGATGISSWVPCLRIPAHALVPDGGPARHLFSPRRRSLPLFP